MKKLYSKTLAFLLAFALCLTMSVPAAFADDDEDEETVEPSASESVEAAEEEPEAQLSIQKTSDKSTYSVGESIIFTISLDELTEGAAATDVIIKDTMPDGIHIKNVTVDGAADAEVTLMESAKNSNSASVDDTKEDEEEPDANVEPTDDGNSAPADTPEPADTDTDDNNDSDSDEPERSDQIYYALVPITSETEGNYIFYDPSGNEIESILINTEESTDNDGNPCVIQSYVLLFDGGGEQPVNVWKINDDETEEYIEQLTASFLLLENESSVISTYAASADEISDAITTYAAGSASNEEKALEMAKLTLSVAPCSYEGLIDILVIDGYSEAEATYAADNCGADWYEQAIMEAEVFLSVSPLSYKGLIEMLEVEKFTEDQATYAANNCGADWYEQAVKSGEVYLSIVDIDYDWLIRLLETEGFTTDEATYAANVLFGYEAEKTTTVEGVEIYIPSIEYGQNVKVTIEAYADEAGEYTNTATATSAETSTVSDSVTIKVQNSSSDDGLNNNGSGQTSGTGTNGSGTTTTTSPKTGELIGFGTLAIIALAAGAILVVTVVTGKHKENN